MTKYAIFFALVFAACTDDPNAPAQGENQTDQALSIQPTEKGIAGTFGDVTFKSEMASDNVLDINVKLNGMVITALVDFSTGVMEYDGYAADTGEDTQMTDEDRAVLVSLESAMSQLGDEVPFALDKFRGFIATWAEHPTTVELRAIRLAEENRSWTSLCYAKNSYYTSQHDCDWGGFGLDANTIDNAYLSSTGNLGGPDGTAFYLPAAYTTYATTGSGVSVSSAGWYVGFEINHDTRIEYAYGNCFGACGAGCPGTYQYTVDCVNHDGCVRFGHATASLYCDDQFTSASDDWASAPNCGP